jgi:hypothetical protein
VNNTTDLLNLRWRAAQWLLAVSDGDSKQVAALREAMRIEGIAQDDILDELALLREQFGRRTRVWLVEEIERLWQKLKERP